MRATRVFSAGLFVLALAETARFRRHMAIGRRLALEARPFERREGKGRTRLLVLGDSSAVGTGADAPEHSVAGRLALAHPDIVIWNMAENGLRTGGLIEPLQALQGRQFTAVLIHVGVNDIVRRTPLPLLGEQLAEALALARRLSDHVLVLTGGNLGLAPALPRGLGPIVTRRTRAVRRLFLEVTDAAGAIYVDMFDGVIDKPFTDDPRRFFARDGFHPNSDGYALWFEIITAAMNRAGIALE